MAAGTLTEDAYRLIKWRITTVQLAPGARFTEPELAESLSLSRTPVREALLLLRTQGLVSVEGRSGYRVSPVTLRDVHDLAGVRRLLEGEAASLAASRLVQPGEIETLEARVPARVSTPTPSWIEADRRFHLALVVAAGNQQLVDALEPVLERSARLMHLVLVLDSPPSTIAHDHEGVLSAVRSHDRQLAHDAAVEQVRYLEDAIARALTSSHSLLTANVIVEAPHNEFYLDVPMPKLDGDGGIEASRPRGPAVGRIGSSKSRSGVSR